MPRRVHVLALGGTIAMTAREEGGGVEPTLDARDLIAGVPGIAAAARIEASGFRRLPGAHLRFADLLDLRRRIDELLASGCDGIVLTQGTDTIEETAFALDLLSDAGAPIVVTGAMRNPGLPGADGPANLLNAVRIAACGNAAGLGVVVTMDDQIHAARFVRKGHTSRPSAFASPNAGPLGWVAEGRVRLPLRPSGRVHVDLPPDAEPPPVALVTIALGDDARVLHGLELRYAGAVLAGFGAGHLPDRLVEDAARLAERIPVVLASRTGAGEVFRNTYGFAGSERDLLARGLLGAGVLDPLKARVLLSLALGAGWPPGRIAGAFDALTG